jgi:hypothetical protein
MRSYIFTPLERERIKAFLEGKVSSRDTLIKKIRFRVRKFNVLSGDVDLYLRLREAVTAKSA